MAFCRQCGASIDENVQFCPNCGTPAAAPTVAPPTPPTPPVYAPPVYAPPVYAPPVYAVPTPMAVPERKRLLNIAAVVILAACLIFWLFVPYISTMFYSRSYSYYYGYYDYDYYYYEGSAGGLFLEMFDGSAFGKLLEEGPFALTVLTSFIFISLGILFTFLKKMTAVRAMAIANTATTASFLFIQMIVDIDIVGDAHVGFWAIFLGMIVLIALSGQRYAKEPAA